jgi:hypothetical protein
MGVTVAGFKVELAPTPLLGIGHWAPEVLGGKVG